MQGSLAVRRSLTWTVAVLAGLFVLCAGLIAAVQAGYFHGLLVDFISARAGRQIQVDGALELHLFSSTPRVSAERVTIGNPSWVPAGTTAKIGKLSLTLGLPGFGHTFGIVNLDMESVALYLVREASGKANWQVSDPSKGVGVTKMRIIRTLSMPNAHVLLADARRHLQFDGTVSALDEDGTAESQPLRIEGSGQLNGKPMTFEVTGDPLARASHREPYHFSFIERSSGSRLDGHGVLPQPFNFTIVDATFDASGADLKDLYFLTGVTLMDTGAYRVTGKFSGRGTHTVFSDLAAASGQSDMHGSVTSDSTKLPPKLGIELKSRLLRLSDLGAHAAGRPAVTASGTENRDLLLSDAKLSREVVRRGDADVSFGAGEVDVGRVPLHAVTATVKINGGVLTASVSGEVMGGKLGAHVKLDAKPEIPAADLELKIADLQLEQIHRTDTGPPPMEGPLQVRIAVSGRGSSVHQIAASANGTVTALLPSGAVRDSLAELTGMDLRGLGLLLAKNKKEAAVRCAVVKFKAHEGTLTAESLVVDTEPVLITGDGQINLDSEELDLALRGYPKSLRLFELHSPVLLRGTLAHPKIDIQARHSSVAIIDPGHGKDADCAALLGA
jgi:uncharacterized protein involved in outer membrane biogenesis